MTDPDVLDNRLRDDLAAAHEAPQWRPDAWSDPMSRLRRAARARRLHAAGAASLVAAAVVVGGGVGLHALTTGQDSVRVVGPAHGGEPGASGLDWLMTSGRFQDYETAHPSPSPFRDIGPSPAPVSDELRQLQSDVAAALPADAETTRADAADGGERGHAVLWLKLADGTPVVVERFRLDYPVQVGDSGSGMMASAPDTWADGTAYSVLVGDGMGYSTGDRSWSGPFVWTATADGWFTSWTAPVSSDRLTDWAQAADGHFTAGTA